MALSLQLGYPDIPKSITNPNVQTKDALDVSGPMAFLTFIKHINVSFEPDSLQEYYNFYIKDWNKKTNSKVEDDYALIVDRYRDFIKDVSLNYTTLEEKQFLSKVDFNDPYDLDVIIGFYGKKLKELSLYYNNKRNDIKFNVIRNKLRGTNFGTERTISELTLSYLKTLDDGKMLFDYDEIESKIEIEIEELYDTYPLYFNQIPNQLVYDNKDLDYGYDIFLKTDTELIASVFSNFSDEIKELKEISQLFENKRDLTKKYISTDFYYLSTGNTTSDIVSGLLFKADNPSLNFLNKDYPTTASTTKTNYLKTGREFGFFKPSKVSIVLVDGINSTFSINVDNLSPNSLYYFPDPTVFGSNGDVLSFIVDDSFLRRNFSSGNAVNQPTSSPTDTKYYGYVSKIEPSAQKYLETVFDSGFVQDSKRDIHNNLFGLFKNDHRFRKTIQNVDTTNTINLIFNGYEYYDELYTEGFAFNYTTADDSTFGETIRSGLSTTTGTFLNASPDLTLFFGHFTPYHEVISPTDSNLTITYEIIEGAFISRENMVPYDDSSSSDLSAFEVDSGAFYFSDVIEGGLNDSSPLQRALLDPLYPSLTANLTEFVRGSALDVVDGGYFGSATEFSLILSTNDYVYDSTINTPTTYTLSSTPIPEDFNLNGVLMVRNSTTRRIQSVLDTLPYLYDKYSSDITDEIESNVLNFDIANDVLFIETPSYLTINKLSYDGEIFKDPKTIPIYIEQSTGYFDKISNRFKNKQDVFYCKLKTLSDTISSNDFIIYPEIYKFDVTNFKNTKIFPTTLTNVIDESSFFSVSGRDVRYVLADAPTLTHSSKNNIYNISFLLKDQNNMPIMHEFDFYINADVTFTKHNICPTSPYQISNILSDISTLSVFLSSGEPLTNVEELII